MILRVFSVSSILTRPATSLIGAMPLGMRASNSSVIRGRPWVMSSARHTTGVEGTHRQLGAGLADGLGGDDADRLADVHQLAGGQRAAVALGADADLGLADQDAGRADGRPRPASTSRVDHRLGGVLADLGRARCRRPSTSSARCGRCRCSRCWPACAGVPSASLLAICMASRALGAAVLLADDHVLRHVHQTPGEVPGVGGAQRGVGQALAGAVGGDEVLQHRQALAEAGLDRARDGLALGVGHQTAHAGDLPDLHRVTTGAGVDHHPDRVGARGRPPPCPAATSAVACVQISMSS